MSHNPHPAWWAPDRAWSCELVEAPPLSVFRDEADCRRARAADIGWSTSTYPLFSIARTRPGARIAAEQEWRAAWIKSLTRCLEHQLIGIGYLEQIKFLPITPVPWARHWE